MATAIMVMIVKALLEFNVATDYSKHDYTPMPIQVPFHVALAHVALFIVVLGIIVGGFHPPPNLKKHPSRFRSWEYSLSLAGCR